MVEHRPEIEMRKRVTVCGATITVGGQTIGVGTVTYEQRLPLDSVTIRQPCARCGEQLVRPGDTCAACGRQRFRLVSIPFPPCA